MTEIQKTEDKPLSKKSGPWALLATVLAFVAGAAARKWGFDEGALVEIAGALVALASAITAAIVAGKVD